MLTILFKAGYPILVVAHTCSNTCCDMLQAQHAFLTAIAAAAGAWSSN